MSAWTRVRAFAGRRRGLVIVLAGGAAGLLALWLVARPAPPERPPEIERWGVDQLRIHRSAGGHLLDLRYRVVDPQRASSLLAKDGPAYLIHDASKRRLHVPVTPKAGALRNTGHPDAGRSYFVLFSNPGRLVRQGDRVSLVLGELSAKLTVE